MTTLGSFAVGTEAISGEFSYAWPTITITAPTVEFSDSTVTVTHTYVGALAQQQHRVKLYNQDQTVLLWQASFSGAGLTADVTYAWVPGSQYTFIVEVFDGLFWVSASVTSTFVGGITVPDLNRQVGSVFEVGINGVGYMLRDHPDSQQKYSRRVASVETPRLATGDTPFSEGFDRYTMVGQADHSSGAGQRYRDLEGSDRKAYWRSEGVDPFERGQVSLLPSGERFSASSYSRQAAVVAGGVVYWATSGTDITALAPGGGSTSFTVSGMSGPETTCTDGYNWYFSDASNIYRNHTAADPGVPWSAVEAQVIAWCDDRIAVAYASGSSLTANRVSVLTDTGTEVGSPQQWTLPANTKVWSITSGGGYMFWAASRGGLSWIHSWNIGSTDSYVVALDMPHGAIAQSVFYYQGVVYIQALSEGKTQLYRAPTSDGLLVPSLLLELDYEITVPMPFSAEGEKVLFGWQGQSPEASGLGAVDLASGGYSTWLRSAATYGTVRSVVVFNGLLGWTIDGDGLWLEDADQIVASGTIDLSISDLGTGLDKQVDSIAITTEPLPEGASVGLYASFDAGLSYTLVGTQNATGSTSSSFRVDMRADSIAIRLVLHSDGESASPVVRTVQAKVHPVGQADRLLTLPINCGDQIAGLNNIKLPDGYNGKGRGARRARTLENLMSQVVYVQDVDWKDTQILDIYEVVSVDIESVGIFDRQTNRQRQDMTAVVTLRGQKT